MAGKIQGRKSWGRAMWGAYLTSPKLATEVRRRLELARLEAPADVLAGLEGVAAVRVRELEGDRPAPVVLPTPNDQRDDVEGAWWW